VIGLGTNTNIGERTLTLGQSVLIADHPFLKSVIGKSARITGFPFPHANHDGILRYKENGSAEKSLYVWVEIEGVGGVEYRIRVSDLI
jgi:hypothetical protein